MARESALWKAFKKAFEPSGHWVRVENALGLGTPDVNGREDGDGPDTWLELKQNKAWPKRATTIVRLRHFTREQKQWLVDRGVAGGNCGVLWQVEKDYLLFGWWDAPYLGHLTKEQMFHSALWSGKNLSTLLQRGIQIERE